MDIGTDILFFSSYGEQIFIGKPELGLVLLTSILIWIFALLCLFFFYLVFWRWRSLEIVNHG